MQKAQLPYRRESNLTFQGSGKVNTASSNSLWDDKRHDGVVCGGTIALTGCGRLT
jgi:hypothetical protein